MLPQFFTKRKIIFFILSLFLITSLLTRFAHAFTTPSDTYQFQFEQAVYGSPDEMNLQSFVNETIKAVMGSSVTSIAGCLTCENQADRGGALRSIGSFIAFFYTTPPASGIDYLADIGRKLNLVQPAHAQYEGGFAKMTTYRDIWKKFRDMTYVLFVLILVIMGFAIMFRVKINPQTVISIQSALPRVVIALILITFSYAIVGLLVDFMFVAANLVHATFMEMGLKEIVKWIPGYPQLITSDLQAFSVIFFAGLFPSISILGFFVFLTMTPGTLLGPFTLGGSLMFASTISLLIILIFAIIFLVAFIRVFWSLLKAYVMVVIQLIFAPFIILVGVLPGSNAITSWFRNLLANLIIFPATLAMLYLSFFLISDAWGSLGELVFRFTLGLATFNTLASEVATAAEDQVSIGGIMVVSFISLGILLLTPKLNDIIKSFMAGKPFEYGTALGEAFGPVSKPIAGAVGYGVSIGQDLGRTYVTQRAFPREEGEKGTPTGKEPPPSSGVLPAGKYTKMERE